MTEIKVQGVGKATSQPDVAIIHVVVQNTAKDQATARRENNVACEAALAILKKVVKDEDIHAVPARVYPDYNYNGKKPKIVAYQANNTIVAKLRDLEVAQTLVNDLNGIDPEKVQIGRFYFDLDKKDKLEDTARTIAYQDAKRKAALYAGLAGYSGNASSVLNLKLLEESPQYHRGGMMGVMRTAALETVDSCEAEETLEIGDIEVSIKVTACFEADGGI